MMSDKDHPYSIAARQRYMDHAREVAGEPTVHVGHGCTCGSDLGDATCPVHGEPPTDPQPDALDLEAKVSEMRGLHTEALQGDTAALEMFFESAPTVLDALVAEVSRLTEQKYDALQCASDYLESECAERLTDCEKRLLNAEHSAQHGSDLLAESNAELSRLRAAVDGDA